MRKEWGVKKLLYTSSIAVEFPEDDKYPAWAKKTGEMLIEASRIQNSNGTQFVIVRPSNVYGRYDNLKRDNLMVVSSLIKQALTKDKLLIDINGAKQTRDLINARDVARGMIKAMNEMPNYPVNLCSGEETSIKEIVDVIHSCSRCEVKYGDFNLTLGPNKKVMKPNWDFKPEINLLEGIREVLFECQKNGSLV